MAGQAVVRFEFSRSIAQIDPTSFGNTVKGAPATRVLGDPAALLLPILLKPFLLLLLLLVPPYLLHSSCWHLTRHTIPAENLATALRINSTRVFVLGIESGSVIIRMKILPVLTASTRATTANALHLLDTLATGYGASSLFEGVCDTGESTSRLWPPMTLARNVQLDGPALAVSILLGSG